MFASFAVVAIIAQSKLVTIEIRIAPAKVVLQKLGDELDVRMIPGGSVSQDVFGLAFREAPSATVLAEIATTLNAQWERDSSGTYILNRTPRHEAEEDEESRLALMRAIRDDLAKTKNDAAFDSGIAHKILDSAKKTASETSAGTAKQLNNLRDKMPMARLMQSVLEAIGPEELLRPWTSQGIAYVANPSASQKALPPSLQSVFRRFESETRIHSEVIDAVGKPGNDNLFEIFHAPFGQSTGPLRYTLQTEIADENQLKVLLMIQSPNGETSGRYRYFTLLPDAEPPSYAGLAAGLTEPIALSDDEKALFDRKTTPNPGLRKVFENLEEKDILSYLTESPFLALAKAKGLNTVYLLSDSAWHLSYGTYPPDGQSPQAFFADARLPYRYKVEVANGTLRVRPVNRRRSRENRFPRAALPNALAKLDRLQYPDIETLASVAAGTTSNSLLLSSLDLLARASGVTHDHVLAQVGAPEALRIFGRLSVQDRAKARSGGVSLPLPLAAKDLDREIIAVLYRGGRLTAEYTESDGIPLQFGMMTQADADLEQNMSVVLANGYPQGSSVRVRLDVVPRIFSAKQQDANQQISMTSPQSIGRQLSSNRPNLAGPMQYAMAPNGELVVDIDLQSRGKKRFVLFLRQSPSPLKMGPLESLPTEIQEIIRGSMKKPPAH